MSGGPWFAKVLDREPRIDEQRQPRVQRSMDLVKAEREPVSVDLIEGSLDIEVTSLLTRRATE